MRLFTLLIAFLVFTSVAFSQHYQTVYAGQNVNFTDGQYALPFYVDSVISLPTSDIFIPANYYNGYDDQMLCLNMKDTTWVGHQIILQQNGKEIYFNELGDSIFIYPQTEVGGSWAMTNLKNGYYIEATISQKSLATFIGFTDSVKTITLQAKDATNSPVTNVLNQTTLRVSKHHGWIEGRDFRKIPHLNPFDTDTAALKIQGLNDGQTGVYNIGFDEIFNFDIGDVFHIVEGEQSFFGGSFNRYDKETILQKSVTTDSIVYTIDRERLQVAIYFDMNTQIYDTTILQSRDTISMIYHHADYAYLNALPLHYVTANFGGLPIRKLNFLSFDDNLSKIAKLIDAPIHAPNNGTCWQHLIDVCEEGTYYQGLGGPYSICQGISGTTSYRELLYYKKGNVEEGDSIQFQVILPTKKITSSPVLMKLYPNPTANILNLKILQNQPKNATINIRNTLGQTVLTIQNPKQEEMIDVSALMNGVYFVSLESEGMVYTEELVIQK